jgi:monofunctional biosynthetic peptidoglycan transglycosylase
MNTTNQPQVFNFNQLKNNQIMLINDSVMGGKSSSKFELREKVLEFTGKVSLKNNGGFASLRMLWPFQKTKVENKLRLQVTGDGKTYQFRLRTNQGYDGAAYVYEFKTIKDKSIDIEMDVNQFVPSFRGRELTDMPQLRLKDVKQMGLLIADNQVGNFNIKLERISVFNE